MYSDGQWSQVLNLIPVGRLIVTPDQTQSRVNREYRRGLSMQPCGLLVFRVIVEEDRLSDLTDMDPGVQSYSQNGISTFVLDISTLFSKCKIK